MDWKKLLYTAANKTELSLDLLKQRFRQRMGLFGNVQILTYTTYCNHEELYISGRVVEEKKLDYSDSDTWWDNLADNYRRFSSNEIAGAKLKLSFSETDTELLSDEDGYFETRLRLNAALPKEELWHHPVIELMEAPVPFTAPVMARCRVMTPPSTADFGVISDIDDTILQTQAQSLMKSLYLTFLNNAHSRLPFEGVGEFYAALQSGFTNVNFNPIFYVSSSPWNLYDFLTDFMDLNKIPHGPVFLKDYGFTKGKFISEGHHAHKYKSISAVLNAYPSLPFILIGDSGQQDPEIYSQIVKDFPGRILAVYIRDVSLQERDIEVKKISEGLLGDKVEMVLAENSLSAAEHALEKKFIHPGAIDLIKLGMSAPHPPAPSPGGEGE